MDHDKLIIQFEITIKSLEMKLVESPEPVVFKYLDNYKVALDTLKKSDSISGNHRQLDKLLDCARGYMETSSVYSQDFLEQMGKSERLIKQL
jgi:hypothetical protein